MDLRDRNFKKWINGSTARYQVETSTYAEEGWEAEEGHAN